MKSCSYGSKSLIRDLIEMREPRSKSDVKHVTLNRKANIER